MKILLAEDGMDHARVLIAIFSKAGFEVIHCKDGQEAYDAVKNGLTPDLLLTDVMMPGLTGFELIQKLKTEIILPKTIMLTAKSRDEDVLRGLDCGALDYIAKPFSPSVVLARALLVLKNRQPNAS